MARQQDPSARFRHEWVKGWREAEACTARERARAAREGRLAEYEADPFVPHPEDEAELAQRLATLLRGIPPEAVAHSFLFYAGMVVGTFAADEAHMEEGIAEVSAALDRCAEETYRPGRLARPLIACPEDVARLDRGLGAALRGIPPATVLRGATLIAGCAIGAASGDEADLQARLGRARQEVERTARKVRSLVLMMPKDALAALGRMEA
jgi:hypothetical protein